jgi:hypothetical protein
MVYIWKGKLDEICIGAVVFGMAVLAARNPGKPAMQSVDIVTVFGNFKMTILAARIRDAVDGSVAVFTIPFQVGVGHDATQFFSF